MLIVIEIAQLLKVDQATAEKVRDHLERDFFDFSECSARSLKKAAKAALVEMNA